MKAQKNLNSIESKNWFEEEKQSPINSILHLPTKELSALGGVVIIGFMSLIFLPDMLEKFSISLPVASSPPPVWKLLFQRGSFLVVAALFGIMLGSLSHEVRPPYFHLKKLKLLDKIFLFITRGIIVLCLIVIAMKCSLEEFKQSAYFDWDKADRWLCEGTLMLIVNGIIWFLVLSLIAYVTSRPRFVAPVIRFIERHLCKEVKLKLSKTLKTATPSLTKKRNKYFYMARFLLAGHLVGCFFTFDAKILNSIFFTLSSVCFCVAGVFLAGALYALSFVIEGHNSLLNQRRFYSYAGLFVLSQAIFHFAINQL